MFSKSIGGIRDTKLDNKISIDELYNLIKYNKNWENINRLHKMEYGSQQYKEFKTTFPYFTPHGEFNGQRSLMSLNRLSGYLYFDIDNTKLTKQFLLSKYSNLISLISKSIGGKGLFFLVKVSNLTIDNFEECWWYMRKNIFTDLNIDHNATGIARSTFLPSDKEVYINLGVSYLYKTTGIQDVFKKQTNNNNNEYTLNDTKEIIPMDILKRRIKTRTQVKKEDKLFTIEDISDYLYMFIPKLINDGSKHFYFKIYIYQLMYLNRDITYQELFSYIYHINKNNCGRTPMIKYELNRFTSYHYNQIRITNDYSYLDKYMKKRKIHFMKNNLTIKQRQSMAAKINGQVRTNETIEQINEVKFYLQNRGLKITQKNVVDNFYNKYGETIGIATVKRNWNKEPNYDFSEFKEVLEPDPIIEDIIDESDFFDSL